MLRKIILWNTLDPVYLNFYGNFSTLLGENIVRIYITSSKFTLSWSDGRVTNDTTHDMKFLNKTYKNISGIWWSMFRVCHDPKQHRHKSVMLVGVKSWGPKQKFYCLTKLKPRKDHALLQGLQCTRSFLQPS